MSCFTSPGLSDSTFVTPCQWCAKLVTDYSVAEICEKLCFDEKHFEICRFNKNKNMPLANLIHKVSHNNYSKTSIKET